MKLSQDDLSLERDLQAMPDVHMPAQLRQRMWESLQARTSAHRKRQGFRRFAYGAAATAAVAVLAVGGYSYWSHQGEGSSALRTAATHEVAQVGTVKESVNYPLHSKAFANQDSFTADRLAQAQLLLKIAYAYEHVSTLSGSFETIDQNADGVQHTVEFQIREGKNPASYEKSTAANGAVAEMTNNNQVLWNRDAEVDDVSIVAPRNPEQSSTDPLLFEVQPGMEAHNIPNDPAWSKDAEQILSPLTQLQEPLLQLDGWKVLKEETLLGRTAVRIEAKAGPNAASEKHPIATYSLWFDKETGLLLKKVAVDTKNNPVSELVVTKLGINVPLDEQKLQIPAEAAKRAHQGG